MPASLVASLKVKAGGAALALVLCPAAGSQAAVYTGSATDPAGDLGLDVGDHLPSPPVDFTHVSVKYDDVAGRVDVSYTFSQAPAPYQGMSASVALGFVEPDGSCSTPTFTSRHWHGPLDEGSTSGQVAVVGRSQGFAGYVRGTVFHHDTDAPHGYVQESWERTALFDWPGTEHKTWSFATIHPSLVRDPYPCARAAVVTGGSGGVGVDLLESNFLELKVVAAPSVRWVAPLDGETVSGVLSESGVGAQRCLADVTGPVVRTENYVDGRLNDTQVNAPWACEWDTRNYVNGGHQLTVKAYDAAGNVIAADTVNVIVNNPNPPPVSSPPAPTTEPAPVVVVVVPTPDPTGTPADPPARRFTGRMARTAAKKALARRYGRAFRLRRGYTASCEKTSATRWSCAVRWRYGPFIYKGKLKLTLRSDGRVATRTVLRKTRFTP